VITDPGQRCSACGSDHTYWMFSSVDGDVWDCGTCGHQWTVEVGAMITHSRGNRLGITPGTLVDLVR
jgi:Zn ribbon nucleic-acid-binding protein